jgi:hypothetical protein
MFHLLCDETTEMLQDIAMILGLPIDDTLVCGPVSPVGWRDIIEAAIDIRPPDIGSDDKDKKPSAIVGLQLTSRPVERMLTMMVFRGTLGLDFGTWLPSFSFQTGVRTPYLRWYS